MIHRVTDADVTFAREQLGAAEAQVVVDGVTGATAEMLAQARANVAVVELAARLQSRSLVLHG